MTLASHHIDVRVFHHTLLWPLLMRGPDEDSTGKGGIETFVEELRNQGWTEPADVHQRMGVDPDYTYEEVVYFHPFVRDFLFGNGAEEVTKRSVRRFKREDVKSVTIGDLPLLDGDLRDPADLLVTFRVERTELLLIRPRVALLLVEISNRIPLDQLSTEDQTKEPKTNGGQPSKDSPRNPLKLSQVLLLQSHLRHIYPPFFLRDGSHGDAMRSVVWNAPPPLNEYTSQSPRDDFNRFTQDGAEPPIYAHWQALLGPKIKPMRTANRLAGELYVQQLLDDRMPALSFIAVDNPAAIDPEDEDRFPAFDPPSLSYQKEFRDSIRSDLRYNRFRHRGTTYYCNGACFASVTGVGDFTDVLLGHFRRHYAHLAVIAQYQHAALLYFADELADAAKTLAVLKDTEEATEEWVARMRRVRRRFLKFLSRSYFREVSNQLQAKALFRMWLQHLDTEELLAQVSATNHQVYEALENHEATRLAEAQTKLAEAQAVENQRMKDLAEIAQWGLGVSIVLAVIGVFLAWVGLYPENVKSDLPIDGIPFVGPLYWGGLAILVALLAGVGVWLMFRWIAPNRDRSPSNQ